MHFKGLALFSILIATVAADGASIIAALEKVNTDAVALDRTVTNFKGYILDTLPIIRAADALLKDLNKATEVAKSSTPLSDIETYNLHPVVNKLNANTNAALDNLVSKKAQLLKLNLKGTVRDYLIKEKDAANAASSAVIAKVPSQLQGVARDFIAPLNTYFEESLAAFQ